MCSVHMCMVVRNLYLKISTTTQHNIMKINRLRHIYIYICCRLRPSTKHTHTYSIQYTTYRYLLSIYNFHHTQCNILYVSSTRISQFPIYRVVHDRLRKSRNVFNFSKTIILYTSTKTVKFLSYRYRYRV